MVDVSTGEKSGGAAVEAKSFILSETGFADGGGAGLAGGTVISVGQESFVGELSISLQ